MSREDPKKKPAQTGNTREDRLKQALKANLAKRKAQSRVRSGSEADNEQDEG